MEDRFKTIEELEDADLLVSEILRNFIYDLDAEYWLRTVQKPVILTLANRLYDMGKRGE